MNTDKQVQFRRELSSLLNRFCIDAELNTPDHQIAGYLTDVLENYGKVKTLTDLNHINRLLPEGRLLFAALIELTTRGHKDKTPDEVIKMLHEISDNTDKANREMDHGSGCAKKVDPTRLLSEAVTEKTNRDYQNKKEQLDTLEKCGNVVLEKAHSSLNPDQYMTLERILVHLYLHYSSPK